MKHLAAAEIIAEFVASGLATSEKQDTLIAAVQAVGIDRYANISYYNALTTLGGEATIGDSIERARVYDTSTSAIISTIWTNEETGLVLTTPPAIGTDVELWDSSGLTVAELASLNLATQCTLEAILAKQIAAPSTASKQDAQTLLLTPTPYTDVSSTITLGSTAQTLLAANASRTGVLFQNISDTDMYLNPTGVATTGVGSYLLKGGGGVYETPKGVKDVQAISVLCATTGKAFTAKWW